MASWPDVHFGVIDDARRRQRRRWLGLTVVVLAAITTAVIAFDPFSSDAPTRPSPAPLDANLVPPRTVFSQSPYMGVTCGVPNSTACDDIGLAIRLKRPALSVNAEIGGRWFALDDRQWSGPARHHRRKRLAGFLRGAGLQSSFGLPAHWEGQPPRSRLVLVRVNYGRGRVVETRVRVALSPGWG